MLPFGRGRRRKKKLLQGPTTSAIQTGSREMKIFWRKKSFCPMGRKFPAVHRKEFLQMCGVNLWPSDNHLSTLSLHHNCLVNYLKLLSLYFQHLQASLLLLAPMLFPMSMLLLVPMLLQVFILLLAPLLLVSMLFPMSMLLLVPMLLQVFLLLLALLLLAYLIASWCPCCCLFFTCPCQKNLPFPSWRPFTFPHAEKFLWSQHRKKRIAIFPG